jgi:hypothetical protein
MAYPDYYVEVRSIATRLFERGEFDWSERIEDAIAGGSTATEILMRVRSCLRELLDSGITSDEEGQASGQLVAHLNDVLR